MQNSKTSSNVREVLQKKLYRSNLLIYNMVQNIFNNTYLSPSKPLFNKRSYILLASTFYERNNFVKNMYGLGRWQNTTHFPII